MYSLPQVSCEEALVWWVTLETENNSQLHRSVHRDMHLMPGFQMLSTFFTYLFNLQDSFGWMLEVCRCFLFVSEQVPFYQREHTQSFLIGNSAAHPM